MLELEMEIQIFVILQKFWHTILIIFFGKPIQCICVDFDFIKKMEIFFQEIQHKLPRFIFEWIKSQEVGAILVVMSTLQ